MTAPSTSASLVQLAPGKNRIVTLDILRGVALLGILLITMPKFALPERYVETILRDPDSPNFKMAYFMNIFFEGKMRALFSMIFGAGIILFVSERKKPVNLLQDFFTVECFGWQCLVCSMLMSSYPVVTFYTCMRFAE
jgi:uncharacterized protein